MSDIKRNLESGGGLYINKFWTGLYKNRSPLFTPVSALGIQLIARQDALWDGANLQITPQFTLRRRYGFLRYCSVAFGSNEWPLNFYSFENLSGTIKAMVDTQTKVYTFTSGALTSIFTKSGGAGQTSFEDYANTMYFVNGVDAKKWDGTTLSNMGIAAPLTPPTLSYIASGALQPTRGYQYGYVGKNSTTGHPSTMSPASASTGPLSNQTVVQKATIPGAPYQITVTNGSTMLSDGGVVFDATNAPLTAVGAAPVAGQYIAGAASVGTYTFAAGDTGKVVDLTYSFSLTLSAGVNISVAGTGLGDAQADKIDIYRIKDGGSTYFYLATINNPGAGNPWTYVDSTLDANLVTTIIAPVAHVNDPPPAGLNLLVWHSGRLWGASGNTLYYSGGPDTLNGVGQEAWPPIFNFTVPGAITALASTSNGLVVWTKENAYVVLGTTSADFTPPQLWQKNWGVASQNAVAQDGDNLFVFTTKGQVFSLGAQGLSEIGFLLERQLGAFDPAKVYMSLHRSGEDEGLMVSDGSANIYRYSEVSTSWDTVMQPVGGCNAIKSIEVSTNNWRLMMGRASGLGYMLDRDLNTWSDDGVAYTAWAVIGSLTVAPPRQTANIASVLAQVTALGTYPTVSILLNEISGAFTPLPNPVPDQPRLLPSKTIWTRRHDLKAAQSPLPQEVQHLQIKVLFATEAQGNELLGIGLA